MSRPTGPIVCLISVAKLAHARSHEFTQEETWICYVYIFRRNSEIYKYLIYSNTRVQLEEQELYTLPEHLSSPPDFSGIRVGRALVFCVVFCRFLFVLFLLVIVLSVHS